MARKNTASFVCENCGAKYGSWVGRCSTCGEWNTLIEQVGSLSQIEKSGTKLTSQKIADVASKKNAEQRIASGSTTFDSVIGGGFVKGSVSLLAGQPGIGKSTLLLQVANGVAKNLPVLYVSGEESAHQVGMRAKRLKATNSNLELLSSNSADDIAATMASGAWSLVVVD